MHKKIFLCKIAVEDNSATQQSIENYMTTSNSFEWDDKKWTKLFPFPTDLLSKLNTNVHHVLTLDKCIDEIKAENFLAVSYNINRAVPSLEDQYILSNIFKNYKTPIGEAKDIENFNEENDAAGSKHNLIQEYVTTALYDTLFEKHLELNSGNKQKLPILPDNFRPTLCDYQARTVHWLLEREMNITIFPNYYIQLQARDGETTVYKHLLSWHIQESEPAPIKVPAGGILADEMGLGKTVEMLALLLLHQRQLSDATSFPRQSDLCNRNGPGFLSGQGLSTLQNSADTTSDTTPSETLYNEEPEKKRKRRSTNLFCICTRKTMTELCTCKRCKFQQHAKCVGGFDVNANNDSYLCPNCWYITTQKSLLKAATTFIVTPHTIKAQWISEINRHVAPALRVFDYNELVAANWISPKELATYDVVLTDYSLLRREIYHTSAYVSDRVTRNEQRSMRRLSPLLMIEWWRVCLDEAQMVESNSTNVAAMVKQLPAINRWAITGTPIQRSIDDLCGLLEFIGFTEPLTPPTGWKALVDDFVMQQNAVNDHDKAELTLVDVLQRCMWRTCKSKVDAELQIPPQSDQVHRIRLSNLEKLFYTEQHALCESSFQHVLRKHLGNAQGILKISPIIMKIILQPLLKIRQSCIIPVVNTGSGQHKGSSNVPQKQFLQPKDLHAHLKYTNEFECKSELRTMASSYNGMAAIYFIRGNYEQSIKHYEMVLRLARDYKDINISVDSLLQIHALHNIQQACYISPAKVKQLSADVLSKYEEDCNALEWKYLEPYANTMTTMRTTCSNAEDTLERLETNLDVPLLEFTNMLAEKISEVNDAFAIALLNRFRDEFATAFGGNPKLEQLQSISGMLYILVMWYQKVEAAQTHLNREFKNLKFYTMNVTVRSKNTPAIWRDMTKFIRSVYDCHLNDILDDKKDREKNKSKLKSKKSKLKLCKLCLIRNALNDYECLLFNKVVDEATNMTEGLENPSFEVALIKVLFGFLRTKGAFISFSQQMDRHWEAIECRQQLCKKLIKYWIEIEYTVKAYDELDMCKMRISLAENEEEKTHFKLLDYELDDTFLEQQMNLYNAQRQFAMKLARLKYITHLEADADTGPCPICQSEDESRYAVLECGHNICLLCLRTIRQYNTHQKLCCPICRNHQNSEKIYYVTRTPTISAETNIQVIGDYSSKITYIVRLILKLQHDHSKDVQPLKILVFSQWAEILHPIAMALTQNGIRHRFNLTPRTIEEFKNPQLGVTCLLMPLHRGCNGLNLIEATHVFLVEPILNPGEEAQAIGRVHRFGQTRSTTVHRFIVCNTIEENIFNVVNAGKQKQANWEFKQLSVESLRNLFHLENDVSEEYIPNARDPIDVT